MMDLSGPFPIGSYLIAPEDVIPHAARNLLASDERLLAIFGPEKIEVVPALGLPDHRPFPRLQISTADVSEQQGATNTDGADVRVIFRIRYDMKDWRPLYSGAGEGQLDWPFGTPTTATLARHILRLLKADKVLLVRFPNGTVAGLCSEAKFGPYNYSVDIQDATPDRMAFNHDIAATYTANLVHSGEHAGKFHNAAANGG